MIQKLLTKLDENKTWNAKVFSSGSFFVFSMMVASALNFLFNAYLGRMLSFADFGVLTFLNTLAYIIGIFTSGLSVTITNETAYLSSKNNEDEATLFFNSMLRKSYIINLIVSIVWIISIPFISLFFNIHDTTPFLLFTPVVTLGIFSAAGWGYLQGMFRFTSLGFITIAEAVGKFIIALILIKLGLQRYAYLPITLSVIFSFVLTLFVVFEKLNFSNVTVQRSNFRFSKRFFFANCIAGLSTTLFLTVDVILAKHYLSAETAGIYSFLSLVGKMIFFFGSMLGAFMFSFIGRDQALKQDTQKTFYRLLAGSAFMASTIYAAVGILGYITLPILFGSKAVTIIPYVTIYGLAMTLFTVSNTYLNYHLAKRNYFFAILSFATTLLLIAEIIINHSSVEVFTNTILTISVIRLLLMIIAHHNCERLRFIWSNLRDFIEAFFFKPKYATQQTHYKKILVFNWRDTKHVFAGGAEVYMHELAKRWIRAGHKVTLFCGNDGNNPRYEIIDGVEVIRRGGFYFVYIWAFLYYMLKFKGKYDVVIDCENGIPFFMPLFAKEKVFLLIHHIHQDVFTKSLNPLLAAIAIFLEMKLMPLVYRNIQVITVSDSSKEEIMKLKRFRKEPIIIYNGVDLNFFKPGLKNAHPTILYLGRLQYYKSLNIFIKAAKYILASIPDAEFIIAGYGEEREGLEKLAAKLNIQKNIKFMGKVTDQVKRQLYQQAWVFVNPSLMEGWGITTIEANACGTPVVASLVSGLKDSVRNPHTGYLVQYGDVDGFAERINELIVDTQKRERMSQDAVKWAANFDWEKSAQEYLLLINR